MPEVLIAFSLVLLGAAAMLSASVSTRAAAIDNAQLLSAARLVAELSDWSRQGGLKVFADHAMNPFDDVDASETRRICFGDTCDAEQAARFYLQQWRQRLAQAVRGVRIVVCSQSVAAGTAASGWQCAEDAGGRNARVIKIGWPAQGDPRPASPRLVFPLD